MCSLEMKHAIAPDQRQRQRRHHTRSRNGCKQCKKHHIRCDESQPSCIKCLVGNKTCVYPSPQIPDRDRQQLQSLPGVVVWQVPKTQGASDPFDTLPIKMELRSRELLHYFSQSRTGSRSERGHLSQIVPTLDLAALDNSCVTKTTSDPLSFRIMLILAALHFQWRSGTMGSYENTFLFHRGESIRILNQLLARKSTVNNTESIKMVAALSMVECSLGNCAISETHINGMVTLFGLRDSKKRKQPEQKEQTEDEMHCAVSETHFNGMLALFGLRDSQKPKLSEPKEQAENEMLRRLLLSTYSYTLAVKSRLASAGVPEAPVPVVWQQSFTALPDNLSALPLLTTFFPEVPSTFRNRDVDMWSVLIALRELNAAVARGRHIERRTHYVLQPGLAGAVNICDSDDSSSCSGCKSMAAVFYSNHRLHALSLQPPSKEDDNLALPSSWTGFVVVEIYYLREVLGLWNDGLPTEPKLFKLLVTIFTEDIEQSEEEALGGKGSHELWFWKLFVMAYATRVMVGAHEHWDDSTASWRARLVNYYCPQPAWFASKICKWSAYRGIVEWEHAKAALHKIVWTDITVDEGAAKKIWTESILPRAV